MLTVFEGVAKKVKKKDNTYVDVHSDFGLTLSADNGQGFGGFGICAFKLTEGTRYRVTVTDKEAAYKPHACAHHFSSEVIEPVDNKNIHGFWTDGVSIDDENKSLTLGKTHYVMIDILSTSSPAVFSSVSTLPANVTLVAWLRAPIAEGNDLVILAELETTEKGKVDSLKVLHCADPDKVVDASEYTHYCLPLPPAFREDKYALSLAEE